jgi:hypothetical protein
VGDDGNFVGIIGIIISLQSDYSFMNSIDAKSDYFLAFLSFSFIASKNVFLPKLCF